jgi:hypothetical protein
MTTKQPKLKKPSDADLRSNPLIGGSKGAAMSGISADDLDEFPGANTLEGDLENDVTPQAVSTRKRVGPVRAQSEDETFQAGPRRPQTSTNGTGAAKQSKPLHSDQRGMDGKQIQSEQLQDHASNRFGSDS